MTVKRLTSSLLMLLCLWSTSIRGADPNRSKIPKEKFHLFVLAGQSNMVGVAKVSDEDRTPHPHIYMLNSRNEWVPAVDPIHFVDAPKAGTGPGRTFALAYAADHPDVDIGLIPCAIGGTPIDEWQPGALDDRTKTHPWDDAMTRTHVALESGSLKGILWHQGEGDTTPERSENYAGKLQALVQRFRTELNSPEVPFILGELGRFRKNAEAEPYRIVMTSLHDLASELPNCRVVSSEGLTHIGDRSHFDAASQHELGRRYYAAFREVNPELSPSTER